MADVKFEKVEGQALSCYIAGRLYIVKNSGGCWKISIYEEDRTIGSKNFGSFRKAAAAARKIPQAEMNGVPESAAEVMLQETCELETPGQYVFSDPDENCWIMDKRTLEARRVREKKVAGTAATQFEAVRNGIALIRTWLNEKKEASKWAWNY